MTATLNDQQKACDITDAAALQWADRHELENLLDASAARSAIEDARTLHLIDVAPSQHAAVGAQGERFGAVELILRDVCEIDPADPDLNDTVCIDISDLKVIVERHIGVESLLEWAVGRWNAEVANRPLVNVHRRSLDDTWRQVIRHLGGDPVSLLGPNHSDLLATAPTPAATAPAALTDERKVVTDAEILRAYLSAGLGSAPPAWVYEFARALTVAAPAALTDEQLEDAIREGQHEASQRYTTGSMVWCKKVIESVDAARALLAPNPSNSADAGEGS